MTRSVDSQKRGTVAFFDFDGTLTTGDTLMPFLKYVVGTPRYYLKLALVSPVLAAYVAKIVRNDIAKQIVLKHYLAGYHINELFEFGRGFSEKIIPTMLRPEGMEKLRWHQEQGHECVLVSASLDIYLETWAKSEGFSTVICSKLEQGADGVVSGVLHGNNCYGVEKVRKVSEWLGGKNNQPETFAYGDTQGDLPLILSVNRGLMWSDSAKSFFIKEPG